MEIDEGTWDEFTQFLDPTGPDKLIFPALKFFHGLSGNQDTKLFHELSPGRYRALMDRLFELLKMERSFPEGAKKSALEILINLSAEKADKLIDYIVSHRLAEAIEFHLKLEGGSSELHVTSLKLWSNLTREYSICEGMDEKLSEEQKKKFVDDLIDTFALDQERQQAPRTYAGFVLRNLTQVTWARRLLFADRAPKSAIINVLTCLLTHSKEVVTRQTVVDILKNCSLDSSIMEEKMLNLEILTPILLLLAGPEEFTDEENEQLPLDLQYLSPEHTREPVPSTRKALLETLHNYCPTTAGRCFLRDNGCYLILREFHKWEQNEELILLCEDVVGVLIQTEEELSMT